MIAWLESEWLAEVRIRDRIREAEQSRLLRKMRTADARLPALLRLTAAWLSRRDLSPARRYKEPDCANTGLGQSSEPPIGLIL
jgi:hypothetical protein